MPSCSFTSVVSFTETLRWVCFLLFHPKSENIMMVGNHPKIGDFGFARPLKDKSWITITPVGTPVMFLWRRGLRRSVAPEVIKEEKATNKVDVYSFGLVVNEIFSGRINFSDFFGSLGLVVMWVVFDAQFCQMVQNGLRPEIPSNLPLGNVGYYS